MSALSAPLHVKCHLTNTFLPCVSRSPVSCVPFLTSSHFLSSAYVLCFNRYAGLVCASAPQLTTDHILSAFQEHHRKGLPVTVQTALNALPAFCAQRYEMCVARARGSSSVPAAATQPAAAATSNKAQPAPPQPRPAALRPNPALLHAKGQPGSSLPLPQPTAKQQQQPQQASTIVSAALTSLLQQKSLQPPLTSTGQYKNCADHLQDECMRCHSGCIYLVRVSVYEIR